MSAVGPTDPEQPATARSEADDLDGSPPTPSAEPSLSRLAAVLGLVELRDERDEDRAIAALVAMRCDTLVVQAETAQLRAAAAVAEKEIARVVADQAAWQTDHLIAAAYRDRTLTRGADGAASPAELELRAIATDYGTDALAAELNELRPLRGQRGRA